MLLNIISLLLEVYGPENEKIIENVVWEVLKQNKTNNPNNYKIQRHTDKHTEDHKAEHHDHNHEDDFNCGCGFIMRAIADPVKFGVTDWAMKFLVEILENDERTDKPNVLGSKDKNLEQHKERAAFIVQ